jgi:O-glycosyl hydrolase
MRSKSLAAVVMLLAAACVDTSPDHGLPGAVGTGGSGGSGGGPLVSDVTVTVNPTLRYQTTEGWGTSLCWWGNVVGGWSEPNRNALIDLLFDPSSGLGLNVVRYNIGGGDAPDHEHMNYGKEMPGFKPTETGDYDWTADANQRQILEEARSRIDPGLFIAEAFSNSPPYWMTASGCASGGGAGNNLGGDYFDDFADYLSEVVRHMRDTADIAFRTLEPFNEPNGAWWGALGRQEGCHFDRAAQATLLGQLATSLAAKGLEVRLAAPDESSFDETVDSYHAYDAATQSLVYQLNTHAYSGSRRSELNALALRDGKKLWASEVDGSGAAAPFDVYPHNHEDVVPGLDLANRILRDLRELRPDAWVFWQAVESEQAQTSVNKNWGLIHADFQNGTEQYFVTKKFHVMAQFTRAIRPGYVMIDVDQPAAVAFLGEATGTLAIVQRHAATSGAVYAYDLSGFTVLPAEASLYRTSATENYLYLGEVTLTDRQLVAPIEAQSITTFVLGGVQ